MKIIVWAVFAYRWGETTNHAYTIGVFRKKHAAIKAAEEETAARDGKYGCEVEQIELDKYYGKDQPVTIHKTKSRKNE